MLAVIGVVVGVRAARKLAVANRIARRQQIHTAAFLNWKQVPSNVPLLLSRSLLPLLMSARRFSRVYTSYTLLCHPPLFFLTLVSVIFSLPPRLRPVPYPPPVLCGQSEQVAWLAGALAGYLRQARRERLLAQQLAEKVCLLPLSWPRASPVKTPHRLTPH